MADNLNLPDTLPNQDTPKQDYTLTGDDLVKAFQLHAEQINQTTADIQKTYADNLTSAVKSQQSAIRVTAEAEKDKVILDMAAKAKFDADNAAFAAQAGTDPSQSSYILGALVSSIRAGEADLSSRDAKIQQMLDANFSDDPLSWLVNKFTIPGEVIAYNNRAQAVNKKYEMIKTLTQSGEDAAKQFALLDVADKNKTALILNRAIAAKANKDVAELSEKLAAAGISNLKEVAALNQQAFSNVMQLNSSLAERERLTLQKRESDLAERRFALEQKRFTLSEDQFALEKKRYENELKRLGFDEKRLKIELDRFELEGKKFETTEKLAAQEITKNTILIEEARGNLEAHRMMQERLNIAASVLKEAPPAWQQLKTLSPTNPIRQFWEGMAFDDDIQQKRLGYNAANAVDKVNSANLRFKDAPGLNIVKDLLTQQVMPLKIDPLYHNKNPAERNALEQTKLNEYFKSQKENIPESGGLYSAPKLSVMMQDKTIQQLQITEDLKKLSIDPNYSTKPIDVFNSAINRMLKGQVDQQQAAAEIRYFYSQIILSNNQMYQYETLAVPRQTNYQTVISPWPGSPVSIPIDMTNQSQLETLLMRTFYIRQTGATPRGFPSGYGDVKPITPGGGNQ